MCGHLQINKLIKNQLECYLQCTKYFRTYTYPILGIILMLMCIDSLGCYADSWFLHETSTLAITKICVITQKLTIKSKIIWNIINYGVQNNLRIYTYHILCIILLLICIYLYGCYADHWLLPKYSTLVTTNYLWLPEIQQ